MGRQSTAKPGARRPTSSAALPRRRQEQRKRSRSRRSLRNRSRRSARSRRPPRRGPLRRQRRRAGLAGPSPVADCFAGDRRRVLPGVGPPAHDLLHHPHLRRRPHLPRPRDGALGVLDHLVRRGRGLLVRLLQQAGGLRRRRLRAPHRRLLRPTDHVEAPGVVGDGPRCAHAGRRLRPRARQGDEGQCELDPDRRLPAPALGVPQDRPRGVARPRAREQIREDDDLQPCDDPRRARHRRRCRPRRRGQRPGHRARPHGDGPGLPLHRRLPGSTSLCSPSDSAPSPPSSSSAARTVSTG